MKTSSQRTDDETATAPITDPRHMLPKGFVQAPAGMLASVSGTPPVTEAHKEIEGEGTPGDGNQPPASIESEERRRTARRDELPDLCVLALGSARVYRGGHEISLSSWKYARTREMFFFLLSHPPCTKEQIGRALWPEASPAQLHNDFRVALFYLRHALGRSDWICFENERYGFNHALPCWYDVAVFERRISEGRRYVAEGQPACAMGPLRAAVELYHGAYLEGWNAGEWCSRQRDELEREYVDALLVLGRLYSERGRYEPAMELYRKAISVDEYLEAAHRELMRCYARTGEYGEAVRHYQQFESLVRDELGVPLSPETQALYAELMQGKTV